MGPAVSTTLGSEEKRKHCLSLWISLSTLSARAESCDLASFRPAFCHDMRLECFLCGLFGLEIFLMCVWISPVSLLVEVAKLMVENASDGGLVIKEISRLCLEGDDPGDDQAAATAGDDLEQSGRGVLETTSSMVLFTN